MSTIPETISLLEQYNKWRRGDDTITMPEPFELGVAISDAVRLLREHATLTAEFEKLTLLAAQTADRNVELRFSNESFLNKAEGYLERAQKAEAQLHALTLICGTSDANKFQSWVDKERERADKAEAECLEQARLLGLSGNEVAMLKSKVFRLTSLWHQLFFLLDITEESDSGNAFKPNYFSSCRIADAESMEKILTKAKHELNAGVNKQDL
jgi:hypothetical protein